MHKTLIISRLFSWVLHNDMSTYNVSIKDVIEGIEYMNEAYNHKTLSLKSEVAEAANFKSAAYRCAYLHKYATLHTVLVAQTIERVVNHKYAYFSDLLTSSGCLNLCSLGGGPGTDILGLLVSLHEKFGPFKVCTNVIDCLPHWNATFNSLIREVQNGIYNGLGNCFLPDIFKWNYLGANLLDEFSDQVKKAISSADIINMIKFISAAICVDTPDMIKRIFELMKPGAIVFFIDNSVGKVKHIMSDVAKECKLEPLFGPIYHERYVNRLIEISRFGYSSCYQTNITIQVWVKPYNKQDLKINLIFFRGNKKEHLHEIQSTPLMDRSRNRKVLLLSPLPKVPNFNDSFNTCFGDENLLSKSFCSKINDTCANFQENDESLKYVAESPPLKRKCLLPSPYSLDYSLPLTADLNVFVSEVRDESLKYVAESPLLKRKCLLPSPYSLDYSLPLTADLNGSVSEVRDESLKYVAESPPLERKCLLPSPYSLDYSLPLTADLNGSVFEVRDPSCLNLDDSKDWTDFSENYSEKPLSRSFNSSVSSPCTLRSAVHIPLNSAILQPSASPLFNYNSFKSDRDFRPEYADSGYSSPQSFHDTNHSNSKILPSGPNYLNFPSRWNYQLEIDTFYPQYSQSSGRDFHSYGVENSLPRNRTPSGFTFQNFCVSNRKPFDNHTTSTLMKTPVHKNNQHIGRGKQKNKFKRNERRFNPYERRIRF